MLGRVARVLDVGTGLAPAVVLAAWLLAGLPLLLVGHLTPSLTIPLAAVLAVPALVLVGVRSAPPRAPVAVLLTVAAAAGFAAVAWTTSSEHVVVRRDPGVYAQTADWLSEHGKLPVPTRAEVFDAGREVTFESPGFYQRGDHVAPQFMTGTAIALTPAGWAAGLRGITRADAVIGALALLAVAAFARRLGGAWAGLLAAVGLALVYPDLQQARSAFSEPAAQLLFFGGLTLLVDAHRSPRGRIRLASHALAGLVIGLGVLVRIDALVELVFLVPALGVLAARGRLREAAATAVGVCVGVVLGLVDGIVESRPYLGTLDHELRLAAAAAVVLTVVTAVGLTPTVRRLLHRIATQRYVATSVAAIVVLVAVAAYAVRPHLMHPRYAASDPAAADIVTLQRHLGLPADGPRTYAEQSMHWLTWWLGVTGVVLGVLGAALLVRRIVFGRLNAAVPFVFVLLGTAAVVLARPSITPDHPWADRRFVPVVIPGLIVAGAWLVVAATRWVRERSRRRTAVVVALVGTAAIVGPAAAASYPLLGRSTERGELAAVRAVCAALPPRAAVLVTGARAAHEWPQALRGQCGAPTAIVAGVDQRAAVRTAADNARTHGWSPVVLADTSDALAAVTDAVPRRVVHLLTREADHQLTRRPSRTRSVTVDVWLAEVST